MSGFEFTFGLISLLLGLGFAHIAHCVARLVIQGRQVEWDWLSPLAALAVFETTLIYWWYQWSLRNDAVTMAEVGVRAFACLILYVMAVAVLPEGGRSEERVSLKAHFERSRRLIFGALIAYYTVVALIPPLLRALRGEGSWGYLASNVLSMSLFVLAFAIPKRWVSAFVLLYLVAIEAVIWLFESITA